MKKFFIYCILLAFLSSCNSKNTENITCEYAEIVDLKANSDLLYEFDFCEYNGNIIIKNAYNSNQHFSIYQISNDSLKFKSSVINNGRGHNEITNGNLFKYDNNLYLTTNYNMVSVNEMYRISNIEDFSDMDRFEKLEVPINNEMWLTAPIDNNNFLTTFAGHKHNSMFGILNTQTKSIKELDIPYPVQDNRLKASRISPICQGKLEKRPNKSEFVYSCSQSSNVFKFTIDDNEARDMKILYDSIPNYRVKDNGDYAFNRNDVNTAFRVSVSDDCIYLLKIIKNGINIGNCIEVYDWNFNIIKKIILDKDVLNFSVSSDQKRLYLARNEEDNSVIGYIPID